MSSGIILSINHIIGEYFMLDINLIRENHKQLEEGLRKRGVDISFDGLLKKDKDVKKLKGENDSLKAKRNKVSKEIPALKKEGKEVDKIYEEMRLLGEEIQKNDDKIKKLESEIYSFLIEIPNVPDDDLVSGGKENNTIIKTYKKRPEFKFKPMNHVELSEKHNLIDYKRGVKIAGNGNCIYSGLGARLEWALLNFFIDEHIKDNYQFMLIPHILNYKCGIGAGQFPKFEDDVYKVNEGDTDKPKFLIPTSETALLNVHSEEILPHEDLPKKYFSYSPCYRREAGSYRADEKGIIRSHQFNKIEMFQFTDINGSDKAFYELVKKAETLMEKLGLHYTTVKLAAGDCGASMARTYDIEVFIPSMDKYIEVSSVSNARSYQARRANIKYKDKNTQKNEFVHALNGSGLATSRVVPAILEQYQQEDGSIKIPKVLVKYMGIKKIG